MQEPPVALMQIKSLTRRRGAFGVEISQRWSWGSRRLCSRRKPRGDDSMAFYELRQYFVRPGKMDEWVKIMEEEIIPFQVSKGMVICGSFRGETDDSAYFWIRRFNSEAEREAQYKAVYETDHWKTKIAPRVPDCLDREKMRIQRIVATSRSPMQ
jgi:hypothetical protein